ncbi:MAG: hypothetical protein KIC94_20620 [Clostridiales bacterium]|nr:hypothetical protein [Clostridiales bacterium]
MKDSKFIVKNENFQKALESLKSVFIPENMTCKDYIDGIEYPHFSWVRNETVLNSETLEEALQEIRYFPTFNEDGDIIDVKFYGEKYGDEEIFFNALAPYIETGSYLCFEGEDGAEWTWKFDNGKVEYI